MLTNLLWWIGGGLVVAAILYYVIWVQLISTRIQKLDGWLANIGVSPLIKGVGHVLIGLLLIFCGLAVLLHRIAEAFGQRIGLVQQTPNPLANPSPTPPAPGETS